MRVDAASAQQSIIAVQNALNVLTTLQIATYKYPDQSCVHDGQSYDYIIVGAGTAGCVLASRLAEDKKTTVLLIEAGGDPPLEAGIPALMLYLKSSEESWNYTVQDRGPELESHKETNDDMSLGKVLGGSSSTSYMIYSTGSKHDYDNWAKIVNDPIWNWDNVLPFLKKSQRLKDKCLLKTDGDFYGQDGNIGLTVLRTAGTIRSEPYLQAFNENGHEVVPSVNGNISLGYSNAIFTISEGMRQSTVYSYLVLEKNPNIHVLKNTFVTKIVFNANKTAVGVEAYVCNKKLISVRAKKEVILSAGVVNTPKLLMLSGIGPREQLDKHKIPIISDLPVGEGLQDHLGVTVVYNMTKVVVPYTPFNPYKYPAAVIVGYVNKNKSDDYPAYQSVNFVNFPKDLMKYCTFTYFYNDTICNNILKTSCNTQMMYTVINKQKFKTQGKVLLRSKNYRDDPIIYTGYYKNKKDLEDHAKIVQDFAQIEESKTFQKLGGKFKDPKLIRCGDYNRADFNYWKCYVKYMVTSQHQYSSTCAMGTVVDPRLRVYGVRKLRVVDASVMPNSPAGGTLGPTIMIGEKAADIIKKDSCKLYNKRN